MCTVMMNFFYILLLVYAVNACFINFLLHVCNNLDMKYSKLRQHC